MSNEIPIHGTPEQVLAFCKAMHEMQGKFGSVPKNAEGKVGKTGDLRTFKFTNYDGLVEYLRPFLLEHGFFHFANPGSVIQKFAGAEGEAISTIATGSVALCHVSGGMCVAEYAMTVPSPRDAGIVHTYCRRYALQGLVGISSDDDTDAEGIQNTPPQQAQKARQEPAKQESKAQPSGDKERAKKGLDAIQAYLKKASGGNVKTFDDYMSQVSAYSQDAWGEKVSVLVARSWDKKVEDVYLWAKKNIGRVDDPEAEVREAFGGSSDG